MTTTTAPARSARQLARRAEIAHRLLPVFGMLRTETSSFLELPVERLLRAAGISRATFYRHFVDKNDLLLALGQEALADAAQQAMDTWRLPAGATRSELEAAVRRSAQAYRPHIALVDALFEAASYEPAVRRELDESFEQLRRIVASHLVEGQRQGFVRPGLHPQETAGWMTWMAESGLHRLVASADEPTADRLMESLADVIWYAIFEGQGRVDDVGR